MSTCGCGCECDGSCQEAEDRMFARLAGEPDPATPERERAEFRHPVWLTHSEAAATLQAIADRPEAVFERTRRAFDRAFPAPGEGKTA